MALQPSLSRAGEVQRRKTARLVQVAAVCLAMSMGSGCRHPDESEGNPNAGRTSQQSSSPSEGVVQTTKDPTVWARYAAPGEKPLDGAPLDIEIEVPPVPPGVLAAAGPLPKAGPKR